MQVLPLGFGSTEYVVQLLDSEPKLGQYCVTSMRSARTTVIGSPPGQLRGILPHLREE